MHPTPQQLPANYQTALIAALNRIQAIIEFDLSGHVLHANALFLDAMGYQLDELVGKHHRIFCDTQYVSSEAYRVFWQQLAAGRVDAGEFQRYGKQGQIVWLQASYNPILDDMGQPARIVKFATDITQSKLQNAEFEGMTRAVNRVQSVIEFDLQGRVLSANDNFLHIFGYTLAEIQGQHHSLFCDPDYILTPHYKALWQRLGQGELDAGEYRRVGKNGQDVWIQSSYNPVFDAAGRPYKVVKFATDITARKSDEMLLRHMQQALHMSNQAARIGTWEFDMQKKRFVGSSMARELFGAQSSFQPDLPTLLSMMAAPEPLQQALRAAVLQGVEWDLELLMTPLQGEDTWVRLIGRAEHQDGRCIRLLGTVQDIDRSKRRETELAQAREAAEKASRTKDLFLATMSHELRTPLNAILGFGQMLEIDDELNEDQQENVHEVLKAGRHLLDLINDVLDLAKISAGHIEVSLETVALSDVLQDCEHLVRPLAAHHGIALDIEVASTHLVQADRIRLKQVLLNLMTNAVKYNKPAGQVKVSVTSGSDDPIRIQVADTGHGIDQEDFAQLFEPFKRLGSRQTSIEGTGIGLSITRRLVEIMGGQIGVQSTVGVGSTFWVTLPRVHALAEEEATSPGGHAMTQMPASEQHRLLYIDDNPVNLKLVKRIIDSMPEFQIQTTHLPELGLELARAQAPDLILLDINMPGMDGYQVLKVLQAHDSLRDVPVLAFTANAMPKEVERGRAAGFTDYLTKPLDVAQFIDKIKHFTQPQPGTFNPPTP
jgi:PAS domain S-box-containing protein